MRNTKNEKQGQLGTQKWIDEKNVGIGKQESFQKTIYIMMEKRIIVLVQYIMNYNIVCNLVPLTI
jgi:hypothetical protein